MPPNSEILVLGVPKMKARQLCYDQSVKEVKECHTE